MSARPRRSSLLPEHEGGLNGASLATFLAGVIVPAKSVTVVHHPVEMRSAEAGQRRIKEKIAIDVHLLRTRISRERVLIPQHQVRILAHVDGAGAIVNADNPRRIQRYHANGPPPRGAPVVHHLARLLVQPPDVVVRVAL